MRFCDDRRRDTTKVAPCGNAGTQDAADRSLPASFFQLLGWACVLVLCGGFCLGSKGWSFHMRRRPALPIRRAGPSVHSYLFYRGHVFWTFEKRVPSEESPVLLDLLHPVSRGGVRRQRDKPTCCMGRFLQGTALPRRSFGNSSLPLFLSGSRCPEPDAVSIETSDRLWMTHVTRYSLPECGTHRSTPNESSARARIALRRLLRSHGISKRWLWRCGFHHRGRDGNMCSLTLVRHSLQPGEALDPGG